MDTTIPREPRIVSGNDFLSPSDALQVINFFTEQANDGEGESVVDSLDESPVVVEPTTWLLAYNHLIEEVLNRRRR